MSEAKQEVSELKDELKSAVKREAAKALELSRAQQDLLLAEKASAKLQTERDDLAKKVKHDMLHWEPVGSLGGAEQKHNMRDQDTVQ